VEATALSKERCVKPTVNDPRCLYGKMKEQEKKITAREQGSRRY
jgi:hypothetical protein